MPLERPRRREDEERREAFYLDQGEFEMVETAGEKVMRSTPLYERATAASIFESTPSCANITVPEG